MSFMAYDENGDYREFDYSEGIVKCGFCGKKYRQVIEEQIPGFRDKSYDICPYCNNISGSSSEEEYYNYKIKD